jgi:hypothetical protein
LGVEKESRRVDNDLVNAANEVGGIVYRTQIVSVVAMLATQRDVKLTNTKLSKFNV